MPTDEQMRSGVRFKKPQPPPFDAESADKRQSQWSAFQANNAGKPGMARSNTWRTPRKQGFNPNASGSDGRPAPNMESNRVHKNKSADLGRGNPSVKVPPPPPGPPPPGTTPTTPRSPVSPRSQRPYPDPTRPYSNREPGAHVPFAEGNRHRTPYTSFIGEKTDFSAEGLRRSYSTRDTTKLNPDELANKGRARSTSPPRTAGEKVHSDSQQKPFVFNSSSESDNDMNQSSGDFDRSASREQQRPGTAPNTASPFPRPKKVPTPPSRNYNGPTSPPPAIPGMPYTNGATDGAQSEGEHPGMQQKSKSNMYANTPSFSSESWIGRMFGSFSTSRAKRAPSKRAPRATPSSLNSYTNPYQKNSSQRNNYVTGADELFKNASEDEQQAYLRLNSELGRVYGYIPGNLDMEVFFKLVSIIRKRQSSGDTILDELVARILIGFPAVGYDQSNSANEMFRDNSFDSYPYGHFADSSAKSRSEENINTNFSPDGWTGAFTGQPDYFAPPTSNGRKQPSPTRRPTSNQAGARVPRAATFDIPTPTSVPTEEVPQRLWGSDGTPSEVPRTAAPSGAFSREEWEKKFQDPSWTFPPPPSVNPPSPVKGGPASRKHSQGRRASKATKHKTSGTSQQPHVVDEDDDDTVEEESLHDRAGSGTAIQDDGDAMDIDTPYNAPQPGATPTQANVQENGARPYAVPPSAWRQQQEQDQHTHHRKTSSATRRAQRASAGEGVRFNTNVADLGDVEPFAKSGDSAGGFNVTDIGQALPHTPQAASTVFTNPLLPRDLSLPQRPIPPEGPQRLTKSSWRGHVTSFGEYVERFHIYNSTMLHHFLGREEHVQAQMANGMGWLEAAGDTSGLSGGPTGFGGYLQGVREDEKVREAWNMAWEKHGNAVKEFEKVRERVRRGVMGGGLPDN